MLKTPRPNRGVKSRMRHRRPYELQGGRATAFSVGWPERLVHGDTPGDNPDGEWAANNPQALNLG